MIEDLQELNRKYESRLDQTLERNRQVHKGEITKQDLSKNEKQTFNQHNPCCMLLIFLYLAQ